MRRNVIAQAEKGKKIVRQIDKQDLTCSELLKLFDIGRTGKRDSEWDMVCTAFYFGIAVGNHIAKKYNK